ncbi:MAG: glycosyltransferase family 4 protein [Candidatus Dormibacteria bacterium]
MTAVTLVTYDDDPPLGGQGVVVRGMRRALQDLGHSVRTVSGRGDGAVPCPRLTGRAPLDLSLHLNRHPDVIRRLGGEIVHASGGPGGIVLLRDTGAPLVYTAHHTYRQAHPRTRLQRALSPLEARAYRRAARVLAVSPSTARAVADLGVDRRRIEVLAPGVLGPLPSPPPRQPSRLLFAGRWSPEKGVLDAVAVMRSVLEQRPAASAAIAGAGVLEAAVRTQARHSRIEVLGRIDEQRLREEYARAAVVLMPSRYEGLGLVALEAQAGGAAVVAYDVDGLRDAVLSDTLVGPGDLRAMEETVLRLLDEPGERAAQAAAAQATVIAEHTWDAVGRRLEEVYASLL